MVEAREVRTGRLERGRKGKEGRGGSSREEGGRRLEGKKLELERELCIQKRVNYKGGKKEGDEGDMSRVEVKEWGRGLGEKEARGRVEGGVEGEKGRVEGGKKLERKAKELGREIRVKKGVRVARGKKDRRSGCRREKNGEGRSTKEGEGEEKKRKVRSRK
ncbi:hypothetical protein Tco_0116498 [Tanacetum coccineum]